jgi:hypothetical protein
MRRQNRRRDGGARSHTSLSHSCLGAGLLHDGGPLGLFLVDIGGIFLGRRSERLGAVGGELLLESSVMTACAAPR